MDKWIDFDLPVFFVTADVGHAFGLEQVIPNFHIITLFDDALLEYLPDSCGVLSLERAGVVDYPNTAGHILEHALTREYIESQSAGQQPRIMFFKPSPKLDKVIQELGGVRIGLESELNRRLEDKLRIVDWGARWLPRNVVGVYGALDYGDLHNRIGETMVVQTARGWAGQSTWIVRSAHDWRGLELGGRQVRVTEFIEGQVLTVNAVAVNEQIRWGQVGRQINPPDNRFSDNPMATVGRVWDTDDDFGVAESILPEIGEALLAEGMRGWFGLDLVLDDAGKVYLLELNPRMTASAGFYTRMEHVNGKMPLVLNHWAAFDASLSLPEDEERDHGLEGSQILLRQRGTEVLYNLGAKPVRIDATGESEAYTNQLSSVAIDVVWCSKPEISSGSEFVRFESLRPLIHAGQVDGRLNTLVDLALRREE